jgi:hypothetical protein
MRDYEALSALLDGEHVDPDVIASALEDPEGRAVLVDFARLRHQLSEDVDIEAARAHVPVTRRREVRGFVWRGLAAASVLMAGVLIGILSHRQAPAPPAPQVVIEFVPGPEWGPRPLNN